MRGKTAGALAVTFFMAGRAGAQTLNIWPGTAPGSETWTQKETTVENTPLGSVVFNVVTPTLTAYLPEKAKATGTGVVIAPGGAFVALAIDLEGRDVARWLQDRGIAAFVLKYRIMEKRGEGIPKGMDMDAAARYGIADGVQALKVVRQRADPWGVSPERLGFAGHTEGAAADLPGVGAGRQPDSRPRGQVPRRVDGGRPQAGGSRLQRGRPRLRHEEARHHQRPLDRRVLLLAGSGGPDQAGGKVGRRQCPDRRSIMTRLK
jgi:hypothetical protein